MQHTGPVPDTVPGEMEVEPGLATPHSTQNLQAPQAPPQCRPSEHRQVLWPAANKEPEWHQLDEDVDAALEATARGDVEQRLQTMSTLIITIASERFGIKEQHARKTSVRLNPNRRQEKITQLRREGSEMQRLYCRPFGFYQEAAGEEVQQPPLLPGGRSQPLHQCHL